MSLIVRVLGTGTESDVRQLGAGQRFIIGRGPEAEIRINDPRISRRHCQLEVIEGCLLVRDLDSRNGTWWNGDRLARPIFARPGDQIGVGDAHILVEREPEPAPSKDDTAILRTKIREAKLPLPDVPGYEILGRYGEGETGHVYRAKPAGGGKHRALKLLPKGASDRARDRFMRAANALGRLDHPNVVRIVDVCDEPSLTYYAMELLNGTTLKEKVSKEPLGTREVLAIGVQIARALKIAHREEIVHRDLAPQHIMVIPGGVAKVVGFSFVKDASAKGSELTPLDEMVGELSFVSPEQAQNPSDVDHRSDLYSLGATLFHAVTGMPPFTGGTLLVLRKVLIEPAPRARALIPDVSPALDDIIAKLLEKAPDDRFQTAEELERALEKALLAACRPPSSEMPVANRGGRKSADADWLTSTDTSLPLAPTGAAFAGGFSGHELLEVVQFLEFHEKSGRLVVRSEAAAGEVHFRDGAIVAASSSEADGEIAAWNLIQAPRGAFEFHGIEDGGPKPEGGLSLKPSSLALELMRQRDDAGRD